jgi:hypothetical protein
MNTLNALHFSTHQPRFAANYLLKGGNEADMKRFSKALQDKNVPVDFAQYDTEIANDNNEVWLVSTGSDDVQKLQGQLLARKKAVAAKIQASLTEANQMGKDALDAISPNELGDSRTLDSLFTPYFNYFAQVPKVAHKVVSEEKISPPEWHGYVSETFLKPNPSETLLHPTDAYLLALKNKFNPVSGQFVHDVVAPQQLLESLYQDIFPYQKTETTGLLRFVNPYQIAPSEAGQAQTLTRADLLVKLNEKHPRADLDALEEQLNVFVAQGKLKATKDKATGKVTHYSAAVKGAKSGL